MIKKVASADPVERMKAALAIDKVLLEKAVYTGIARSYFKGLTDTDTSKEGMRIVTQEDDFYDDRVHEKPGVMYYRAPDPDGEAFAPSVQAISIGPDASTRVFPFAAPRYYETFSTLETGGNYKDIKELYVYPYDIVTFFENNNLRVLLDMEDDLFFRLQNKLLYTGREELRGMNVMVANQDTFSAIQFSNLKDFHKNKKVPFSRLLSHFSVLNVKERTMDDEIREVSKEGINGNTTMDTMFGMTPLALQDKKYCYYSFDKSNETSMAEKEQFFIDLDNIPGRNVAELGALGVGVKNAAGVYIKNIMEGLGYSFTAPADATALYKAGFEFCQYLDADNFYPRIPIYGSDYEEATGPSGGKEIVAVLGKTMMRSVVLTPRPYFGHFDLFLEDAKTVIEKSDKRILFNASEDMIMTAKNVRAVTALDIWKPVVPYSGS